ncbi:DUF2835 family protein [Gallaecimonas xiamenensis]|uniref:DUF2835 domain-containing protein n=1 Tax=Gallaecimonas xiamenensis 3-C-1 TaxID=745411 RepID=K2K460_9GAMM|nr:DUF2835 family protein [Gallaecimonas xiamenensis]EKE72185.1 hypothetical protein B3C1_11454 [Gallaecimonas xiamenensis 3-C-1]
MRQFVVSFAFDYSELEAAYQRPDSRLLVRARCGQLLSIPFRHLRPYLQGSGLHGRFAVELDSQNRIQRLYPLP